MIEKLQNSKAEVSNKIHALYQAAYAIEAKLLNVKEFPPLKRPFESYQTSKNIFFGYFKNEELAGIIEIENCNNRTSINSLVVNPLYFRSGIGKKLTKFIFHKFNSELFIVETGAENIPATELYKNLGFKEVREWNTNFGIRKVLFERRGNSK